jgi:hypothetical protein
LTSEISYYWDEIDPNKRSLTCYNTGLTKLNCVKSANGPNTALIVGDSETEAKAEFYGDVRIEGKLAGFNFDHSITHGIYCSYEGTGAGFLPHSNHANIAFYIGANTCNIGGAPFRVDYDGNLKANLVNQASAASTDSDRNKKNSFTPISDNYIQLYDNLNPLLFKYNDGTSDRFHMGFIAQDFEQAQLDAGLTMQDWAVVCCDINEETGERTNYRLRYEEIIPMNVHEIQKLKSRVSQLEQELENLKSSQNSAIINIEETSEVLQ